MSLAEFLGDQRTFDAVVRNIQIIGEAVKHIPKEVRQKHPEIEWTSIMGLRNIVIHEYFGIDKDIIWNICKNKAPEIIIRIQGMIT
ncbi:protein containing DUF86 [Candidatus Magnetobacterium bavaricum]|uniref:Protein containing DUF86 n=1 Tax=Candidatus Magnetobacterium bavaricum TaxID=29290 RepID=A0A0F3GNM1_9BACT|nr:protein containing DUF86 [Candidatus Magnetobacterium bavaricum]